MNLAILAERHVERYGERVSLIFEGTRLTNVWQLQRSRHFATALAEIGVVPGDRVGVMLPNSPDVLTSYGAITRVGAVIMPMVFLLAVPEVQHILHDSGAKVVITSPEFAPKIAESIAGMPSPPIVIVTGAGPFSDGTLSFESLLAGATTGHPIVDRDSDDLAVVSYTSGTTGRPKGVMLTHGNQLFNAETSSRAVPIHDGDVTVMCLPLAHLFGISVMLTGQMVDATGVMLPWFTAEGFFAAVNDYGVTSSAMVPTMLTYMLQHPDFEKVNWSTFRWVVMGAAPLPLELTEEFEKRTGARVLEGYGLTETSPTATVMRIEERRQGSCGRPVPGVGIRILDDDDKEVPVNTPGEVCIQGPNVMKGYYNMPEETATALRGGWFHSGDIGHVDEDGYLYITDRKKDMIIRGGFNIYPRDVEEVLYGHPAVGEVGVVGIPDARLGEEVRAYVVLKPGAEATEEELLGYCRSILAKYKTPKSVVFTDALPKNPIGKILKKDLREIARQEMGL
ncbi:MAG: long-chain fatty acid--CoA ligase [Actinomycetota bacterium]